MEQASVRAGYWLWIYFVLKTVNKFEQMDIAEYIYEGVVEPY